MLTELLIAPPASGKTHAFIQRIQAQRKTDPLTPVWGIVPERLQAGNIKLYNDIEALL